MNDNNIVSLRELWGIFFYPVDNCPLSLKGPSGQEMLNNSPG